jgi:hypothetical protein
MRNFTDKSCRENKTCFVPPPTPPPPRPPNSENHAVREQCGKKYCTAGQATDDNIAYAHCMMDNKGYKYTLTISNTFPQQKWLHDRASLLRYTYTVCLVTLL